MRRVFLLVLFAGGFANVGCNQRTQDLQKKSGDLASAMRGDMGSEVAMPVRANGAEASRGDQDTLGHFMKQLAVMDAKIGELQLQGPGLIRGHQLFGNAISSWEWRMQRIEVLRRSASSKLVEIEKSLISSSRQFAKEAQITLEDLKIAIDDASSE
ncbi:MAG: hypothetical protein WCI02_12725 [Planctomycetota bacterium]|jgi:hypothetical protein